VQIANPEHYSEFQNSVTAEKIKIREEKRYKKYAGNIVFI
jgi:hypothetical protein